MTLYQSKGFSLIELVIVIMIGFVLLSTTTSRIARTRSVLAAAGARQAFLALHARTRAQAVEFGATARLMIDVENDSAWIVQGGNTITTYRFVPDGVDLQSDAGGVVQLCMIARGYSESRCNSFAEPVELTFATAEASQTVVLFPMGQVTW